MHWKVLYGFKDRSLDWWILTVLPLMIIGVLAVASYTVKGLLTFSLFLLIEETLIFAIVLSSTDLALRSRMDKNNRQSRIIPLVPLIIAMGLILVYVLIYKSTINIGSNLVFVTITGVVTYFSVLSYNNNTESDRDLSTEIIPEWSKKRTNFDKFESSKGGKHE